MRAVALAVMLAACGGGDGLGGDLSAVEYDERAIAGFYLLDYACEDCAVIGGVSIYIPAAQGEIVSGCLTSGEVLVADPYGPGETCADARGWEGTLTMQHRLCGNTACDKWIVPAVLMHLADGTFRADITIMDKDGRPPVETRLVMARAP